MPQTPRRAPSNCARAIITASPESPPARCSTCTRRNRLTALQAAQRLHRNPRAGGRQWAPTEAGGRWRAPAGRCPSELPLDISGRSRPTVALPPRTGVGLSDCFAQTRFSPMFPLAMGWKAQIPGRCGARGACGATRPVPANDIGCCAIADAADCFRLHRR